MILGPESPKIQIQNNCIQPNNVTQNPCFFVIFKEIISGYISANTHHLTTTAIGFVGHKVSHTATGWLNGDDSDITVILYQFPPVSIHTDIHWNP